MRWPWRGEIDRVVAHTFGPSWVYPGQKHTLQLILLLEKNPQNQQQIRLDNDGTQYLQLTHGKPVRRASQHRPTQLGGR